MRPIVQRIKCLIDVQTNLLRSSHLIISGRMMGSLSSPPIISQHVQSLFPPLTPNLHKGQCGKIGVIGGCSLYTGAPYFAAITPLKMGADLSYVFCPQDAALTIKGYSPELIVYPTLNSDESCVEWGNVWDKLHAFVVGPGLGLEANWKTIQHVLNAARQKNLPVVFDADSLHYLESDSHPIQGYDRVILTPNPNELRRMFRNIPETENDPKKLSAHFGGATLLLKGTVDVIVNEHYHEEVKTEGSNRRCGGQGDILSGSVALFAHWALQKSPQDVPKAMVDAAKAGSEFTRTLNRISFAERGRSMTASDMIADIPKIVKNIL